MYVSNQVLIHLKSMVHLTTSTNVFKTHPKSSTQFNRPANSTPLQPLPGAWLPATQTHQQSSPPKHSPILFAATSAASRKPATAASSNHLASPRETGLFLVETTPISKLLMGPKPNHLLWKPICSFHLTRTVTANCENVFYLRLWSTSAHCMSTNIRASREKHLPLAAKSIFNSHLSGVFKHSKGIQKYKQQVWFNFREKTIP